MARTTHSPDTLYELLRQMDQQYRAMALPLPETVAPEREDWVGIGFRLGGARLVVPLREVSEIVPPFPLTPVPGARRWLRGVGQLRGELLPVTDLHEYLLGRPEPHPQRSRILITRQGELSAGLAVGQVEGLQRFRAGQHASELPPLVPAVQVYVNGAYRREYDVWAVFALARLVRAPGFLEIDR